MGDRTKQIEFDSQYEDETLTVDKDKIERLVRHEDAVVYGEEDVAEAPKAPLFPLFSEIKSNLSLTNPMFAEIIDVDVNRREGKPDKVTLKLYVEKTDYTYHRTLRVTHQQYGKLLKYLNLEAHQILELTGKQVPIRKGSHDLFLNTKQYKFDFASNFAFWSRLINYGGRAGYKYKLLNGVTNIHNSRYTLTTKGISTILISQFLIFIFGLVLFMRTFPGLSAEFLNPITALFLIEAGLGLGGVAAALMATWSFTKENWKEAKKELMG